MLFVGEYTHLFTVAAAKLVSGRLGLPNPHFEWFSNELRWPDIDSMQTELQQSLRYLTSLGVKVCDWVDATALTLQLPSLAGAIWAHSSVSQVFAPAFSISGASSMTLYKFFGKDF